MGLPLLILQISVILVVCRIAGAAFRVVGQPQVVGEMVAGIVLGPSVFGRFAPGLSSMLFPVASFTHLNDLSQIGLVLFMFLIGLSINAHELREFGHAAVLISHVSIVAPFSMAAALSLFLYPHLSDAGVPFSDFSLFMGAAMSITAFPVLARILSQRDLLHTRLGTLAIACAAVDDVTGWCMLAGIVVLIRANHTGTPFWLTLTGSAAFTLIMMFGARKLLRRLETYYLKRGLTDNLLTLIIVFALACALITEALGMHLLFGAFLAGGVMPRNPDLIRDLQGKFESVTVLLLLPLYFAVTGLRTSFSLIHGFAMWGYCAVTVVVGIVGKLGGSMLAARVARMSWRESAALGILMNTRGLMELVILNIGLDIGVISPALFSMMVVMALVTTLMTTPLLNWVYPRPALALIPIRSGDI